MDEEIAYLFGVLHDGYIYRGKKKGQVAVFTQKLLSWLQEIEKIIERRGENAWIFPQREIFVLETKFSPLLMPLDLDSLTSAEQLAYIAGFFDAEGGLPKNPKHSKLLYINMVQKDEAKLLFIKKILESFGIKCGKMHQYDKKKSGCWRFYIRSESLPDFVDLISSKHAEKRERLTELKEQFLQR